MRNYLPLPFFGSFLTEGQHRPDDDRDGAMMKQMEEGHLPPNIDNDVYMHTNTRQSQGREREQAPRVTMGYCSLVISGTNQRLHSSVHGLFVAVVCLHRLSERLPPLPILQGLPRLRYTRTRNPHDFSLVRLLIPCSQTHMTNERSGRNTSTIQSKTKRVFLVDCSPTPINFTAQESAEPISEDTI